MDQTTPQVLADVNVFFEANQAEVGVRRRDSPVYPRGGQPRARPPALIPVRNQVNQTKGCYFLALDATCLEK
ncbi:MAG TPA: hypothetical protein VEQ62_04840 [Stellaceae bacterium]|nr:hypothetical protein [Stellaceae bacterium]